MAGGQAGRRASKATTGGAPRAFGPTRHDAPEIKTIKQQGGEARRWEIFKSTGGAREQGGPAVVLHPVCELGSGRFLNWHQAGACCTAASRGQGCRYPWLHNFLSEQFSLRQVLLETLLPGREIVPRSHPSIGTTTPHHTHTAHTTHQPTNQPLTCSRQQYDRCYCRSRPAQQVSESLSNTRICATVLGWLKIYICIHIKKKKI